MGKTLGSWSGIRRYLEHDMLAECLHGRIRYGCTTYIGMDGCHIFEMCVDGKQIKRFSWETVNTYFIEQGYKDNKPHGGVTEYWEDFWRLLNEIPMESRTEYTDEEFCHALEQYRNQNIQDSIWSNNPLIRMFAVLDRRIGKRTLSKIESQIDRQPDWLKQLYRLRFIEETE